MESLVLRSRRRLIERPRLLRALDRSTSNLRTIVASAGYGKTTLAEQWAAVEGRRVGWYRARTSASDVSVVARGLAEAAARIVPDAGRRMLERLAVTGDPDREARLLAEMLASDLQDWPRDGWIVVDDFHHLQAAPDPETFVETLVSDAPVQILLVGRNRPRWVSARDVLYGDVLEIGRAALAMNADEIDEMLGDDSGPLASGLLAVADGWPAVVALSAAAARSDVPPSTDVPEELFDFFAEEVFRALPETTQGGLTALAGLPLIDADVAFAVLGSEAMNVIQRAASVGLLSSAGGRYELHPLVISYVERLRDLKAPPHERLAATDPVFDLYIERSDWDAAFEIAVATEPAVRLPSLIEAAAPSLVSSGRCTTLEHWVERANQMGIQSAAICLAEAELAIQKGRLVTALMLLESPMLGSEICDSDVAFAASVLRARALHIASREADALLAFDQALTYARNRDARRVVLEGRLSCAAALELPEAHDILDELSASADTSRPLDVLRLADRKLSLGLRFGRNRRLEVGGVIELVDKTADPFARLSFLCLWGWSNALACRYEEALSIANRAGDDQERYRLDVCLPYVRIVRASALAGLRAYDDALHEIDAAIAAADVLADRTGVQNGYALKVRVLVACGEIGAACELEPPVLGDAIPFAAGEALASRALALVSAGRLQEAMTLASDAKTRSRGVETRVLARAVNTLCVLRSRSSSTADALSALMDEAFDADAPDAVVTAYRGNPELLAALCDEPTTRERAGFLVSRAGDRHLVDALSERASRVKADRSSLSLREREVFDLICDGLSNRQIAERLFIAESTVKAHVHRIFDKLEIRSRSALAIDAAMRRYAASTETDDAAESSS